MSALMEDFGEFLKSDTLCLPDNRSSNNDPHSAIVKEGPFPLENCDNATSDAVADNVGDYHEESEVVTFPVAPAYLEADYELAEQRELPAGGPLRMDSIECCECGDKFSSKDVGVSKILRLCKVHFARIQQGLPGGCVVGKAKRVVEKTDDDDGTCASISDNEEAPSDSASYDEAIDGSLQDQTDIMDGHSKVLESSDDFKETQRLFVIDKLYAGPLTGKDLGELLHGIKKTTTRLTIPVSMYQIQVYDSRFDEDDFVCRGSRSCYYKGEIVGIPKIPILFGYDTFTAYYCSNRKIGYMCYSAICPLRDPSIISGYVLVALLRTRCNSPRLDAIIYSAFVRKCFRKFDFIKWIDGNFTNLAIRMPEDIHSDINRALEEFLECGRWKYDPNRKHLHRDTRNPSVQAPKRHNMKETRELNDHVDPLMIEEVKGCDSRAVVDLKDVKGKPTLRVTPNASSFSGDAHVPMLGSFAPPVSRASPALKALSAKLSTPSPSTQLDTCSTTSSTSDSKIGVDASLDELCNLGRYPKRRVVANGTSNTRSDALSLGSGKADGGMMANEFISSAEHNKVIRGIKQEMKLEAARGLKTLNNELSNVRNKHNAELRNIRKDHQAELKSKARQINLLQEKAKYLMESNKKLQMELLECRSVQENIPPTISNRTNGKGNRDGGNKKKISKKRATVDVGGNNSQNLSPDESKRSLSDKERSSPVSSSGEKEKKKKAKLANGAAMSLKDTDNLEAIIDRMISARTSTGPTSNVIAAGNLENQTNRLRAAAECNDRDFKSFQNPDDSQLQLRGRSQVALYSGHRAAVAEYQDRELPFYHHSNRVGPNSNFGDVLALRHSTMDSSMFNSKWDGISARGSSVEYNERDRPSYRERLLDNYVEAGRRLDNLAMESGLHGHSSDLRPPTGSRLYGSNQHVAGENRHDLSERNMRFYGPPTVHNGPTSGRLEEDYRQYYR